MAALRVECHAGYRGEEEPRAFWLAERRVVVTAIIDRRVEATAEAGGGVVRRFRVRGDDQQVYELLCRERTGDWELV